MHHNVRQSCEMHLEKYVAVGAPSLYESPSVFLRLGYSSLTFPALVRGVVYRKCPSVDYCIPRLCKHDGHSRVSGVLTAVVDQLEDQWDRLIPSEIAGDRVMGKSDTLSMAVL